MSSGIWCQKLHTASTRRSYNYVLDDIAKYCEKKGTTIISMPQAITAEYLCEVTNNSPRPRSILAMTTAALTCLMEGLWQRPLLIVRLNYY